MTRADKRKYHYIYKITRLDESGKYYIGLHSTDNINDGYFGSGSYLSRSIKKHGRDKHIKEILEFLPTREALKLREKQIVNDELLGDKRCMNLKLGGEGGWDHVRNAENYQTQLQNAGKAGGFSQYHLWSPEKKKDMIDRRVQTWKLNTDKKIVMPDWVGRKHKPETIEKMRKSKNCGENNSQFGTCWITNGKESYKIQISDLEIYQKAGFFKGRKMRLS